MSERRGEHLSYRPVAGLAGLISALARSKQRVPLLLALLTYPLLLPLASRVIAPYAPPFPGLGSPVGLAWLVVAPLPFFAFLWGPLHFAWVILFGKIHCPRERSRHYASVPLELPSGATWPPVSVHLPIHTEPWATIRPTLVSALETVADYNHATQAGGRRLANLVVSDDGLQLLIARQLDDFAALVRRTMRQLPPAVGRGEQAETALLHALLTLPELQGCDDPDFVEGLRRLCFYSLHQLTVVARPQHGVEGYQRRGEFAKASNLNATLQLDEALERYRIYHADCDAAAAWQAIRACARWRGFFVLSPACLGSLLLLLDKDSKTPTEVLRLTVPEFVAERDLAFTVHPTLVANATENLTTRLLAPGATLYHNYWLPYRARFGIPLFSGHSAMLRKQALRAIGYWPEDRIAEDYVCSLRLRQQKDRSGRYYFGRYVAFPGVVFSEEVPTRFIAFVQMLKKYTAGSIQMFINPLPRWWRDGILTTDIRRLLYASHVKPEDKLSVFLVLLWYLAMVPVVLVAVTSLHFLQAQHIATMALISVGLLAATNAPFWAAYFSAWRDQLDPFALRRVSPWLPLRHALPATLFHVGLPFHLFAAAAYRLMGDRKCFGSTQVKRWRGETVGATLTYIFRESGPAQLLALCHLLLVAIYLGWPAGASNMLRFVLCVQWGVATILAPYLFDEHLHRAIRRHLRVGTWLIRARRLGQLALLSDVYRRSTNWIGQRSLPTLILVASALLLVSQLDYNAPSVDESFYQVAGRRALTGGPLHYPYVTGSVYMWPLISHAAETLAGPLASRAVAALLVLATTALVFRLGGCAWTLFFPQQAAAGGRLAGCLASALFVTSPSVLWIGRLATYDALALMLLALGIWLLLSAMRQPNKRRLFLAAFFFVSATAASFSVLLSLPFVSLLCYYGVERSQRKILVVHFLVPTLFMLAVFFSLNHPFALAAIRNAINAPRDIPHTRLGALATLGEISRQLAPLAIIVTLGCLAIARRGSALQVRCAAAFVGGALSILGFFLLQGHTFTLERRLAMVSLILAPPAAAGISAMLMSGVNSGVARRVAYAATLLSVAFLYGYAQPLLRANQRGHVNMSPVLDALMAELIAAGSEGRMVVGYASYENRWYLKQKLERAFPGRVTVDESGPPRAGDWRRRLRDGWRPDLLVGVLADRYGDRLSRQRESAQNVALAAKYGYVLNKRVPVSDDRFGPAMVDILVRRGPKQRRHQRLWQPLPPAWLNRGPIVAYSPSGIDPTIGRDPTVSDLRDDLRLLRSEGFSGLITYTAAGVMSGLPALARSLGFGGTVIMGLADPQAIDELRAAVEQQRYVDAYCVGNEGLGHRYSRAELLARMRLLRSLTAKPVTTSEPVARYFDPQVGPWLLRHSDFILPIVHPYWARITSPLQAVAWTVSSYRDLSQRTRKAVLVKEVGLPHRGDRCCSHVSQRRYFSLLARTEVRFAFFEAFDQPWKTGSPVEPYWGLHDRRRRPYFDIGALLRMQRRNRNMRPWSRRAAPARNDESS